MKDYEARPIFRSLAAILAICGWVACIGSCASRETESWLEFLAIPLPVGLIALGLSFVAITGRVPWLLRWVFLTFDEKDKKDDKDD